MKFLVKSEASLKFTLIVMTLLLPVSLWANEMPKVDSGNTAWMLVSNALVLLMIPGLAMFYGGLVRTKNVLGTMMQSFAAMAMIGVLWTMVGYSMCFGPNILGGWVGWNSDYFFLKGIDDVILEGGVPEYVFAMFQGKFAIITPAILAGAFAERASFKGYCLFSVLWALLVYNPLCHWVWASDGFLFNHGPKGAIDFAGGTVVHISAGISGLVVAILLGKRKGYQKVAMTPNNLVMTLMGAGLLWVGWFGFNAGSSLNSSLDSARALSMTQIAAASGALCWLFIEWFHHGKASALGIVSGILAGLVAVTPAAGVVQPVGAMVLGAVTSLVCYGSLLIKNKLGYDDSLDAFGIHGTGGIVGALLLVPFIRSSWMADAAQINGGSWSAIEQLGVQAFAVFVTIVYSISVSVLLYFVVKYTVGFRLKEEEEVKGLDKSQHGEHGYGLLDIQ